MYFKSLRLHGFKSFVDPTDLVIGEGLTGIVGPNGCGKSNLVEALRWVMGETSPKRMRGGGMDDVIFAGTATRPSRNVAEVGLTLGNEDRDATAEFNGADELAVLRKIERGGGSDYRLNGKPVRQRDVQLLFADQATGAQSTSVVGQGEIDALIRAKPQDRKRILEEASGTAGLQARRHEAELKLKAAEQNLTRADDVLRTLEAQLRSLKTQVRQASRYRNLAEHIRKTEAALLHLRWIEAEGEAARVDEALRAAENRVGELMTIVAASTTAQTDLAADMPALRQAEAAAAAIVQKLTLERERIDAEAARTAEQLEGARRHLEQSRADENREQGRLRDGQEALARLEAEDTALAEKTAGIEGALPDLETALAQSNADVLALEAALTALMKEEAEAQARAASIAGETQNLLARQKDLARRRAETDAQRSALAAEIAMRPDLALAQAMLEACETELARRQEQAEAAQTARAEAEATVERARQDAQEAQTKLAKITAEAQAIAAMLAHHDGAGFDQVIDLIAVTPGLENALAVALGESLTAALDPVAAMYWRALDPLSDAPALPEGTTALADHVKAPAALARSLSQIGLVENRAQGEAVAATLQAGQILVSRDGWAWRWDGFTLSPEAKTASALRLQQRNRLAALEIEIAQAQGEADRAAQALLDASSLLQQCQALDGQTRDALKNAFRALNDARDLLAKQEREAQAANLRLAAIGEALAQIVADLETVRERAGALEDERAALPDIAALRAQITDKKVALADGRSRQAAQQAEKDRLESDRRQSAARRAAIANERTAWADRMEGAGAQVKALSERIAGLESEIEALAAKPAELDALRGAILTNLTEAENHRREAADTLIQAEQKLALAQRQLKQDEAALGAAREERVRAQGAQEAAQEHFNTLRERIKEKLDCAPEALRDMAQAEGDETPSVFELEQLLGRYVRERDNMGPVNLRAEMESEATQGEIDKLTKERDDLTAAIGKLRHGIGQLNREARERLNNAFGQVNERFQKLFLKLFGGGKAWLELIENEDPMLTGLEIVAAPPGKKQQILTLLSGGERTLTALALLFAVFQTNPSPICVLDEAEAALDEGNIGRFCELVGEIAGETGTRFLIITHQRLTMAHMDRLFGVTMSEKGVSQLVSVDLAGAVALRDGEKPEEIESATTAQSALEAVQAA